MNNSVGPLRPQNVGTHRPQTNRGQRPQNNGGQRNAGEPRETIIDVPFTESRSAFGTAREQTNMLYIALWCVIVGELAVITLMWALNIAGLRGFNIPVGIGSTLVLLFLGFLPRVVAGSAVFGGIIALFMDRDKSQGIATGPIFLFRIVIGVSFSFLLCAYLLMFWNFQPAPGAFWMFFIGAILLVMINPISKSNTLLKRIISGAILFVMAMAMASTLVDLETSLTGEAPHQLAESFKSATSAITPQFVDSMVDLGVKWWPLGLIVVGIIAFAFDKARPYATVGIVATAVVWGVLSIPPGKAEGPCAAQNNTPVPEEGLMITLCSEKLAKQNIMSIPRNGPRKVEAEFATVTMERYGDILNSLKAEDFVTIRETGVTDGEFHFYAVPNNDTYYKYGLHNEPLVFMIKYKKMSELPAD